MAARWQRPAMAAARGTGMSRIASLVPLLGLAVAGIAGGAETPIDRYDTQVVRLPTRDEALIRSIGARQSHMIVRREKGEIVFEADAALRAELDAAKLDWRVDADATRGLAAGPWSRDQRGKSIPGFACYRTVAETTARLAELRDARPDLVTLVDIGDSWQRQNPLPGATGDDLTVARLSNAAIPGPKPALLVMTAIHAREYPTAELGLRFVEWLVTRHGVHPDATWVLDHHEVHVLVQSNPDGRVRAQTQSGGSASAAQRKNLNANACGSGRLGVDLNRNYGFEWGAHGGSSPNPCQDTYRGSAPQSEPETLAVDAYMALLFPDRRGFEAGDAAPADTQGIFIDVHNYAEQVLWPWGGVTAPAPNAAALTALGRRLAYFSGYEPMQSVGLYPTDGTTDDNAYGKLGVASYTIELGSGSNFFTDCATFENEIWPQNFEALLYAARAVRAPYLLPGGPDAYAVAASPPYAFPGDAIELRATLSDARYNQMTNQLGAGALPVQSIVAADAYAAVPPWQAGAVALPMTAADGSYDASTEEVVVADIAPATPGPRLYFVQGRDASGAHGTVRAGRIEVLDPAQAGSVSGTVRSASGAPLAATVSANAVATRSRADTGAFLHRLPPGTYDLTASAPHHESASLAGIGVAAGSALTRDFSLYALCPRLAEDAENGAGGWTPVVAAGANTWGIVAGQGYGGTRGWTESPTGNYADGVDTSLVSPVFDLAGHTAPVLAFDSYCDTEAGYDFGRLEVRTGPAAPWTEAFRCDGDPSWRRVELALGALAGATQAQLRLRFTSDGSVVRNGWVVDNLLLEAGGPTCRATQFAGAPSTPDLAAERDSGESDSDNVTNAASLRLLGSCTPGDTVELVLGGVPSGVPLACAAGSYEVEIAVAESPALSIAARATRGPQTSAPSAALTVTVDRTVPPAPAISGPALAPTPAITLAGSMAENAGRVVAAVDGSPFCESGALSASSANQWSCAGTLADSGPHTATARQRDLAGNLGPASPAFAIAVAVGVFADGFED